MKNKQYKGEGARLYELLEKRFKTVTAAAAFFGMPQSGMSRTLARAKMSAQFWRQYAPKLRELGLNPAYISDPENQPMFFEDVVEIEIIRIREKMAELEALKANAKQQQTRYANRH